MTAPTAATAMRRSPPAICRHEGLAGLGHPRSRTRRHFAEAEGAAGHRRHGCSAAAAQCGRRTSRGRGMQGATDMEIHDTVLIAAVFCMFNRYVDGLGTFTPSDPEGYRAACRLRRGARLRGGGGGATSGHCHDERSACLRRPSRGRNGMPPPAAARSPSTRSATTCSKIYDDQYPRFDGRSRRGGADFASPEDAARHLKAQALEFGADIVGICEIEPSDVYRGRTVTETLRGRGRPGDALAGIPGRAVARVGDRVPARVLHARRGGDPARRPHPIARLRLPRRASDRRQRSAAHADRARRRDSASWAATARSSIRASGRCSGWAASRRRCRWRSTTRSTPASPGSAMRAAPAANSVRPTPSPTSAVRRPARIIWATTATWSTPAAVSRTSRSTRTARSACRCVPTTTRSGRATSTGSRPGCSRPC